MRSLCRQLAPLADTELIDSVYGFLVQYGGLGDGWSDEKLSELRDTVSRAYDATADKLSVFKAARSDLQFGEIG